MSSNGVDRVARVVVTTRKSETAQALSGTGPVGVVSAYQDSVIEWWADGPFEGL